MKLNILTQISLYINFFINISLLNYIYSSILAAMLFSIPFICSFGNVLCIAGVSRMASTVLNSCCKLV